MKIWIFQLKSVHFFQNCGTFQYKNNKYHNFEKNEERATVFKWADFNVDTIFEIHDQKKLQFSTKFINNIYLIFRLKNNFNFFEGKKMEYLGPIIVASFWGPELPHFKKAKWIL